MTGIESEKFAKPEGLSRDGVKAYNIIMKMFKEFDKDTNNLPIDSGGCTTFYSPKQWKERDERYGTNSLLLVVHDGGDVSNFFNYDCECYELINKMDKALREAGFYAECCTNWHTAIYKL